MINTNSFGFLGQFYFSLKNNFKKIIKTPIFTKKKFQKPQIIIFNISQVLTYYLQL